MDSAVRAKVNTIATASLSSAPRLFREVRFGAVLLWLFEAPGVYPREWVCIVSTSSGDCYCSSQDLRSFQKLVLDANVGLQSIDNFEEWFTLVAPRKFLLMTTQRHPELFGQDERFHDPAIVSDAFEFFCQDADALVEGDGLTDQKFYKFRVVDEQRMVVEEIS